MEHRAMVWMASFSLLAILLINMQPMPYGPKESYPQTHLQETNSSPMPDVTPTARSPRAQRITPTPKPAVPVQHNPGLVIGAIIVVAIIMFGVIRFHKK